MSTFRLYPIMSLLLFALILTSYDMTAALTDEPGKEASIYNPIIRVMCPAECPEKSPPNLSKEGFIQIIVDSKPIWVKATPEALPHLKKLPVGGLIDLVIEFQGKPKPPLIKSWKLASGDSSCNVFDGKVCVPEASKKTSP